jgi:hypothetical protein
MNISKVKTGDVVQCEIRGWTFLAYVDRVIKEKGSDTQLMITPAVKNCSHRHCSATEVKKHYVKQGRVRNARVKPAPKVKETIDA